MEVVPVHQCSDTWRKRNSVLNLTSREPAAIKLQK